MATTSLPWQPLHPSLKLQSLNNNHHHYRRQAAFTVQAFRRSDLDGFTRRVKSGEAWKDAWRSANNGFEWLIFETKRTAERIDREYEVSRRFSSVTQLAVDRARELDRELEIGYKWRNFTTDFRRNLPRYRTQLSDFLDTPIGRSMATIFFLWFALSGWLFRILIFATWVLPFAGPLLIGTLANNFAIKGACPACKKEFIGSKNQIIRCTSCGNTVWQPKGKGDNFSKGGRRSSAKSDSQIIDVEYEEK